MDILGCRYSTDWIDVIRLAVLESKDDSKIYSQQTLGAPPSPCTGYSR